MTDPTNRSLEAAILDQMVAGMMGEKPYAYVPVISDVGGQWGVGLAIEGEHGYNPIGDGFSFTYDKRTDAEEFCDGMNRHIGLTELRATEIIVSSMRKPNRLRLRVEEY